MNQNAGTPKKISNEIAALYQELYEAIPPKFDKKTLSKFFPIQGSHYEEADPKIMIIGRSVNGWGKIDEETADAFASNAIQEVASQKGFVWINTDDYKSLYYADDDTEKKTPKYYNLHRSPFWRVAEKLTKHAQPWGSELESPARWYEYIVWSNLYPIAPLNGGNAPESIKKKHHEICAKLLLEQIQFYKPTRLVFITDWDWWFGNMAEFFPDVKRIGDSTVDLIVGEGEILGAKAIVTVRPEGRPDEAVMAEEVFGRF